jgi:hypothetical protein
MHEAALLLGRREGELGPEDDTVEPKLRSRRRRSARSGGEDRDGDEHGEQARATHGDTIGHGCERNVAATS